MKLIRLFVLAFSLGACGTPEVTGNAQGGIIPWFGTNEREVFKLAQDHCSLYERDAQITQIVPRAGGSVTFSCVNRS